jgi:hypothetical protein
MLVLLVTLVLRVRLGLRVCKVRRGVLALLVTRGLRVFKARKVILALPGFRVRLGRKAT